MKTTIEPPNGNCYVTYADLELWDDPPREDFGQKATKPGRLPPELDLDTPSRTFHVTMVDKPHYGITVGVVGVSLVAMWINVGYSGVACVLISVACKNQSMVTDERSEQHITISSY